MSLSTIKKDIKTLTISDIHLLHPRCSTKEMIRQLYVYFDYFKRSSQFTDLDFLFLAGDVFDGKLERFDEEYYEIVQLFVSMMRFCSRFNIKLRVLRGTISHDLDQLSIVAALAKCLNFPIDFAYYDTLALEHDEDTGMDILYVPDNLNPNSEHTYEEVLKLLEANGLTQVHMAIMHGYFGFQLPEVAHTPEKHDERSYLELVSGYINIGHVHVFGVHEHIIAQGSFTRKAHNEEEPKGGVVCHLSPDGTKSFQFIENKEATIFKRLDIKTNDIQRSIEMVRKFIVDLPKDSHVLLRVRREHPFFKELRELRAMFPDINFTRALIDKERNKHHLTELNIRTEIGFIPISITKENISRLIKREIEAKHEFTAKQLSILDEVVDKVLRSI